MITLTINGEQHQLDVDPDMPLLYALRDILKLKGTKFGCGSGLCGACTVHMGDASVRSCSIPVSAVTQQNITTIEGIGEEGDALHPVQDAWLKHKVAQCGYCQAGQIMSATALLKENPSPSDEDIDNFMEGNICRCGTYPRIRAAIKDAAKTMQEKA